MNDFSIKPGELAANQPKDNDIPKMKIILVIFIIIRLFI